jgi:CubicO group peptidase (beta-lactamase class C family)
VTTTTLFQAASISKPVNAAAALLAVAHGQLSLDAPINDSLTHWKIADNDFTRTTPVTLRQLLSHTAGTTVHGFRGYEAGAPLPTLPHLLDGARPANSPAVVVAMAPGAQESYYRGLAGESKAIPQIVARQMTTPVAPAFPHNGLGLRIAT